MTVEQQWSPLEDPLNEKEIFADEVAGVGMRHHVVTITLANVRYTEPVGAEAVKARRVVTGRLVLTTVAAGQLLRQLQSLAAQIEAAAATAAGHKPN
jgi:hypothetical protein